MNQILVYVHYGNYDETKLKMAVNLIDHLDNIMEKHVNKEGQTSISIEQLSIINKEYLQFIGQKKQLIERLFKASLRLFL